MSTDGRVIYPHYYAPAIITSLRGFYETVVFNKVSTTFDLRSLRVSLSVGSITDANREQILQAPWRFWVGSDNVLRDTYITTTQSAVGTEQIGSSGVQAFQNSRYRDFNPSNLISGMRMTTTTYR